MALISGILNRKTMILNKNTVIFIALTTLGETKLKAGADTSNDGEQVDENGRISKGPFTLKNGAVFTGQWLMGMRDGFGT
jgi:hypothetical protein